MTQISSAVGKGGRLITPRFSPFAKFSILQYKKKNRHTPQSLFNNTYLELNTHYENRLISENCN